MKIIFFVFLLVFSWTSFAGSSGKGKVLSIEFTAQGKLLFSHDGQRNDPPGCVGANFTRRWALDATTAGGKTQMAGLLMAYAAGKNITIRGTGNCSVWGDSETAKDFWTSN